MPRNILSVVLCLAVFFLASCAPKESSSVTEPDGTQPTGDNVLPGDDVLPPADNPDTTAEENKPVYVHQRGFNPCQFNFGAAWDDQKERDSSNYAGLDYISVWLGDNDYYNVFETRMVRMCTAIHATPMVYAYVIAEFGKDHGLSDCNVKNTEETLCSKGAELIREFFADSILFRYKAYAEGMRDQLVDYLDQDINTYETLWLIEPDLYQYSESASKQKNKYDGEAQEGGGIPDAEIGYYFKQIVETIKTYLPAAKIVADLSPWIADKDTAGLSKWFSNFDMSQIDYVGTSGGTSLANSAKITGPNKLTWIKAFEVTGKPVLADAGYGAGGGSTGHKVAWDDVANITARMADGVIGVMQMNAAKDYPFRADTIRPQLTYRYPWCPEE